jgi:type I restriction enzyme R subunit
MQTVFTKKHHIEYADLFEPPFTSFGPNAPLPLLHKEDLTEAIAMCDNLEKEVFVDA